MRHQKRGRKLGRHSAHRNAMWANMVTSLLEHERIETTDAKAKEIRRIAEKTITWAASVGKIVNADKSDAEDKARVVHAIRMASRVVHHKPTLTKLFSEIGPRFVGRAGGYTRVMKSRNRHGDAAPMSIIELVERGGDKVEAKAEKAPAEKAKATKKPAKKDE